MSKVRGYFQAQDNGCFECLNGLKKNKKSSVEVLENRKFDNMHADMKLNASNAKLNLQAFP